MAPVTAAEGAAPAPKLREAFAAGAWAKNGERAGEACEECVAFSTRHYPDGLNASFNKGSEAEVIEDHIQKFEGESRDIARAAPDVLELLKASAGLRGSSVVVDVGAGTGLFMQPLAAAAKKVLAMEVSPHFVAHLRKQSKVQRLLNVTVIEGKSRDPCIPEEEAVDIAFICDVYHHFEYPTTVCGHIFRALRPGGRLLVIDLIRDEAVHKSHKPGWITEHVRADKEVFRAEIESVGFRLLCEPAIPSLPEHYCLVFERPPA